ncbi:unnamed protein product [Acanthoscelides obtectus]|uniref:Uncharacterized protein n=1 Tax=Acanthoscelides obtectus TaxID=200917 RepID=A0A9P0L9H6_ACAOB|nr:unnamed protein product [Acanthoscelides obtectus]CAK1648294.1 hypothetical protein AOBTE_LOCUS15656 [Acanthoscelides obtectus]
MYKDLTKERSATLLPRTSRSRNTYIRICYVSFYTTSWASSCVIKEDGPPDMPMLSRNLKFCINKPYSLI